MIILQITKRTDRRLLHRMKNHYSKPQGFVGRVICYSIECFGEYFGHIIAGSATRFLLNRNEFFGIELKTLNLVANNIFFNCEPVSDKYPLRNFTTTEVVKFLNQIRVDWFTKYSDVLLGVETLVELPRTGELYKRSGFKELGVTKGFTCKRTSGIGTDSYGGKRVWNTENLKPKIILGYKYL